MAWGVGERGEADVVVWLVVHSGDKGQCHCTFTVRTWTKHLRGPVDVG